MTKKKKQPTIYFTEQQNIQRFYIRLILLFEIIFFSGMLYRQVIEGKPAGPYPITNAGLFMVSVLLTLPVTLLFFIHVKTEVTDRGIEYYLMPAKFFHHRISREELDNFNLEKRKGKTTGLYLHLKNGKQLFLPSQHPQKLHQAVDQMMQGNLKKLSRD